MRITLIAATILLLIVLLLLFLLVAEEATDGVLDGVVHARLLLLLFLLSLRLVVVGRRSLCWLLAFEGAHDLVHGILLLALRTTFSEH